MRVSRVGHEIGSHLNATSLMCAVRRREVAVEIGGKAKPDPE